MYLSLIMPYKVMYNNFCPNEPKIILRAVKYILFSITNIYIKYLCALTNLHFTQINTLECIKQKNYVYVVLNLKWKSAKEGYQFYIIII